MLSSLLTASYDYSSIDPAAATFLAAYMGVVAVVSIVVGVLLIVAQWKIFTKAGEPGWAAIVPFYGNYVLFKIAFGNGWFFLLCLIPYVNFVMIIILSFKLAKAFGKGVGYGFGLWLLSPIFYLMLGFGSAEYVGA